MSVICVRTMLAAEVLLHEQWVHGGVRVHAERDERHLCHLFCNHCVINSLVGILTPCERTMVLDQYARSVNWVDVVFLETVNDDNARVVLIFCHHVLGHCISARDAIVEVVGVSCADVRDVQACLSPSGSIGGVGVYHAAQLWEGTIEYQVGRSIRRWV